MTADLVAWLRQQLDHDEQVARAALDPDDPAPWASLGTLVAGTSGLDRGSGARLRALRAHIALHDPARMLRQVAAHRAILDLYVASIERDQQMREAIGTAPLRAATGAYRETVLRIAATYSDRPGYDPAWTAEG